MVWCESCGKNVPGIRPYDGSLACNLCGRILENFNFSTEVTFVKNAAGATQASGNVVRSVHNGISSSRERRLRIARDEFMNLKDALGIGDERDDVVDMAAKFFKIAIEHNFTKGRRTELVQCSCLYLTCREMNIPYLLIDFSSYLNVSVYELGSAYLQLCEMLYIADEWSYEKLVDPSIFLPRFTNSLLGKQDKAVVRTARDIIASMKRDWIQTGRKPSGICGAALYTAALSHGIKCSKTDIVKIVHVCEATLTKRLIEFGDTEAGSLNVDELIERERELYKLSSTTIPNSETKSVLCKHQKQKDCIPFGYGLCKKCYDDFISVSGGLAGGSDPPAFQRAQKERMEKAARLEEEKNQGGEVGSLNHDEQPEREAEKCQGKKYEPEPEWTGEVSDESGNFSDISDGEVDGYINNEEERRCKKIIWEEMNKEHIMEQEAKEKALKEASDALKASSSGCPEHARLLVEAAKAAVSNSRKEKQQKRAEEAKNAPHPANAMEAVRRTLDKKGPKTLINLDALEELFNTNAVENSPKRLKTESYMEEKKEGKKEMKSNEGEDGEDEVEEDEVEEDEVGEDEEGYVESYDMNKDFQNDEKMYEEEEEDEEEDGCDFF